MLAEKGDVLRGTRQLWGWIRFGASDETTALGFPGCWWIHTFGVREPLDVVYCRRDGTVLRVVAGLLPNRIGPWVSGGWWVWEMKTGRLAHRVAPGDILELVTGDERNNGE